MSLKGVDTDWCWTPLAEDRKAITALLVAIKATGSVDSDESVKAQDALLKVYYPTLVEIAKYYFKTHKHQNIGAFFDAEDLVSGAFIVAVRNIVECDIDPTISGFNGAFFRAVIGTCCTNHKSPPPFFDTDSILPPQIDERDFPAFAGEVAEFWAAFKAKLIPQPSKQKKAPFEVGEIELYVMDSRVDGHLLQRQVAKCFSVCTGTVARAEKTIQKYAILFLSQNREEFPELYSWYQRVQTQKAEAAAAVTEIAPAEEIAL